MSYSTKARLATGAMIAAASVALTGCSSSAKTSSAGATTTSPAASSSVVPATAAASTDQTTTDQTTTDQTTASSPAGSSGGGAKCTDLTSAAATKLVGKPTRVSATGATPLAGLTICDVAIDNEVYPVQLDVDTTGAAALFAADKKAFSGVAISGLGDQAFTSSVGVEVLSGTVDIKVTGPAGPVLEGNYTVTTAIAKAMIAALK